MAASEDSNDRVTFAIYLSKKLGGDNMNKKAQLGNLYQYVLVFVMVGLILAVAFIVLGNFASTTGVTATANSSINSTINALTPISSNWLPVLVIIAVTSIILSMVLGAFGSYRARK